MNLRSLCFASLFVVSLPAMAQNKLVPHVMSVNGTIIGVGYEADGLQPALEPTPVGARLVSHKGCVKVTATQNSQSLRMLSNCINGLPVEPRRLTIHRCLPGAGGTGGGQVSFLTSSIGEVEMPALDVAATEAGFFELMYDNSEVAFDGFFSTSPEEKAAIKAQKMWLPSNFRCTIGDLPTARISKIDSFTIKQGIADVNGDGKADYVIPGEMTLTIPVEDMPAFQQWFNSYLAGGGAPKLLTLDYLDADGTSLFQISVQVSIQSLGFADLYQGTASFPGRDVQVALKARGIIASKPSQAPPGSIG